jgi:diguanylate cyclase (GGDEF)-like protein
MSVKLISLIVAVTLLALLVLFIYLKLIKLRRRISLAESKLASETEHQKALTAELTALKEKFVRDVLYDPLTGLPGRQVFEDRLDQILNQSKRFQLTFGVLFLDLDGFKKINDALGYQLGDAALKEVGLRLQRAVRQVDTVSRFSSNEFAIIAAQLAKPESVAYIAQRILDALAQPFKLDQQEIFMTASVGISVFPTDTDDARALLKNATIALNQAKLRQNTYQFYRADMQTLTHRELALNVDLQSNMIYKNFHLTYQPRVDYVKKQMLGLCASLHWDHSEFGLLPLTDFMLQAENCGKINELSEWLIRQVLQQYKAWQDAGMLVETVALPLSSRQLENPRFPYKLSQLFQEMQLDPSCLVLEISETALLTKVDMIEKVLNMLKHLGIHISLIDFGVGQLPLQQLKRFPIDSLKIASSLTQDMMNNKNNTALVKMIIAIAKSLGIKIFAVDVATREQLDLLKELGCHAIQGSLICDPMEAYAMTKEKLSLFLRD